MGLAPKVTLPAATTFGTLGGIGAKSIWAGTTVGGLLNAMQDEIGYDAATGRGSSLGTSWDGISAATASIETRLRRLESLGVYDAGQFDIKPDGSTDNTGSINFALGIINNAGGGILQLEGGDYHHATAIAFPTQANSVMIRGRGIGTLLRYTGSLAAGSKTLTINGTPQSDWSQRAEDCGLDNLTRYCSASGSSDVIGTGYNSATGCFENRIHYVGWRRAARYGTDYADSVNRDCTYDFCGSTDDSNKAVITYTGLNAGYWACDSITELHPRFENNGDRIMDCRPSPDGNWRCAKIRILDGPKTECSVQQMGGSASTGSDGTLGAAFHIDSVSDFEYLNGELTLQQMRAGHAVIPAMFKLLNCYGVRIEAFIAIGAGTFPKCFARFFDIDGGGGFHIKCFMTSGNENAYPTNEFKFSNTPVRLDRRGTTWAYYPTVGVTHLPPKADSGTVPSATDW